MLNALGQVVATQALPTGSTAHPLPLAGLPGGVYSLRLCTSAGTIVRKLVVN